MTTVNLNADIGESYGVFHVGAAKEHGVSVGAHPSFDDLCRYRCSEMVKAGHEEGLRVAEEAFCDRTYDDSGKIRSRKCADAVIRDPQTAVQQVLSFIAEGAVIARTGKRISTPDSGLLYARRRADRRRSGSRGSRVACKKGH